MRTDSPTCCLHASAETRVPWVGLIYTACGRNASVALAIYHCLQVCANAVIYHGGAQFRALLCHTWYQGAVRVTCTLRGVKLLMPLSMPVWEHGILRQVRFHVCEFSNLNCQRPCRSTRGSIVLSCTRVHTCRVTRLESHSSELAVTRHHLRRRIEHVRMSTHAPGCEV